MTAFRVKQSGELPNFLEVIYFGNIIIKVLFRDGFEKRKSIWKTCDLLELADGSLLISDDAFGKIYRVSYK